MAKKNNKDSFLQKLSNNIGDIKVIGTAIAFIGLVGYHIGRFQSRIEHKTEIMELRQQYNEEITNIKLDYNNRIIELQNELKMIELSKK